MYKADVTEGVKDWRGEAQLSGRSGGAKELGPRRMLMLLWR